MPASLHGTCADITTLVVIHPVFCVTVTALIPFHPFLMHPFTSSTNLPKKKHHGSLRG